MFWACVGGSVVSVSEMPCFTVAYGLATLGADGLACRYFGCPLFAERGVCAVVSAVTFAATSAFVCGSVCTAVRALTLRVYLWASAFSADSHGLPAGHELKLGPLLEWCDRLRDDDVPAGESERVGGEHPHACP